MAAAGSGDGVPVVGSGSVDRGEPVGAVGIGDVGDGEVSMGMLNHWLEDGLSITQEIALLDKAKLLSKAEEALLKIEKNGGTYSRRIAKEYREKNGRMHK